MHARRKRKTREGHAVLYILPKETHGPHENSGSHHALVEISANQGLFRNRLGASGGACGCVGGGYSQKGAKSRAGGQSDGLGGVLPSKFRPPSGKSRER